MAWVQWDDTRGFQGMVRHLPDHLQGRDNPSLQLLGLRELVVRQPEDNIARFPALLGNAKFEKQADGRVLQTFPDADFSVARVREDLTRQMKETATRELSKTDWYVVRAFELNKANIPADVTALRTKIRDHVDWLEKKIAEMPARELVDFQWKFPQAADQTMVDGVPVQMVLTPPPPVPETPLLPDARPTGEGIDPDAEGVFGNDDPSKVDPAPPPPPPPPAPSPPATTDGPVLTLTDVEEHPHLDANGFPLVTAYAPTVEDIGPRPDQQ